MLLKNHFKQKSKYSFETLEQQDAYFNNLKREIKTRTELRQQNGYLYDLLDATGLIDRYFPVIYKTSEVLNKMHKVEGNNE